MVRIQSAHEASAKPTEYDSAHTYRRGSSNTNINNNIFGRACRNICARGRGKHMLDFFGINKCFEMLFSSRQDADRNDEYK